MILGKSAESNAFNMVGAHTLQGQISANLQAALQLGQILIGGYNEKSAPTIKVSLLATYFQQGNQF